MLISRTRTAKDLLPLPSPKRKAQRQKVEGSSTYDDKSPHVTLFYCQHPIPMTQDYRNANRRIAKNTLVVYGQLMLKLFLGLYTSRLAIEALGVSDFGLYSVVGGVVAMFTFISNSLSATTIRFVNVERGKPDGDLNRVFNVCNVLHITMAFLLLLLLEGVGVYYIHHFLNIEPGGESDAMFVFQVSVVTCCLGIINVPFSSIFNAEEKFLFTAVVEMSAKVAELILLIWLLTYEGNHLLSYALIETVYTVIPFAIYHYYAYRRWPDIVGWRLNKTWKHYKEVLVFSTYNLLSSVAVLARGQGSILLINYFFGTVVNGSFAIAKTVERNIGPFANGIQHSSVPQITQSYSAGDMNRVFYLASRVGRYCTLMTTLCLFPLWSELDFVLSLWLVKVPDGAVTFSRVILLLVLVAITDGGLGSIVNASGKIRLFTMAYSLLTISCIPIGFYVLKEGAPAYMLLVIFLIADILWRTSQLVIMHSILHFPSLRYCRDAYLPVIVTSIPVIICLLFSSRIHLDTPLWHIGHLVFIFLLTVLSAYYLGLRRDEREKVVKYLLKRIRK